MLRAGAWETDHELAKLGKPVDRDEWLMTPQTVNAYYHPRMNEIVFPAAILQPPFFDPEADDAANYGGDRRGDRPRDRPRLRRPGLASTTATATSPTGGTPTTAPSSSGGPKALIAQYDALTPAGLPGHHVNGALTVGENIGDLGGLTIALKAYQIAAGRTRSRR